MSDDDRPDYADLMRSPYDPEAEPASAGEGDSVPWVPPVVAAIVGALVVGVFVISAVVQDPDDPASSPSTSPIATEPEIRPSEEVPDGFTPVLPDLGVDVAQVEVSSRATAIAVATAVAGAQEVESVAPLDPAYWVLANAGTETPMATQYSQAGSLGNITVEFPPFPQFREAVVIPYLPGPTATDVVMIELDSAVPQTVTDLRLELTSELTVRIDELTIGDGWGWLAWEAESGGVAKVDTIVTFVGTDDPATEAIEDATRLTSPHLQGLTQGSGSLPLPPLFGFAGSGQLVRSGEPLSSSNQATAIAVEFTITHPESVSRGPEVPVRPGG